MLTGATQLLEVDKSPSFDSMVINRKHFRGHGGLAYRAAAESGQKVGGLNYQAGPDGVHKRDTRGEIMVNGFVCNDSPFEKYMDVPNKLAGLGLERDWSLKKDFKRRRMPELFKPNNPESQDYLPSIKNLNIGHI